jgi:hypothetical protein
MTLAQFLRRLATLPPHTRAAIWQRFRRGGSMRAAVTAWLACVTDPAAAAWKLRAAIEKEPS